MQVIIQSASLISKPLQPPSLPKAILISSETVKHYASFINPSVNITDHSIEFRGMGKFYEGQTLLRVPLTPLLEQLPPQSLIRITATLDPASAGNNNPTIGITDGCKSNEFYLIFSIVGLELCTVIDGRSTRKELSNITIPGSYTLLLDPAHQFGSCMTNNGITASVRFNTQVDTDKRLSVEVSRIASDQNLIFNSILIEFL